jgi:hypothetical protein
MNIAMVAAGLFVVASASAQDLCMTSDFSPAREAIRKILPEGWTMRADPTERIVGLAGPAPACELSLRDTRPASATSENTSKHPGAGETIFPSYLLWFVERKSPDVIKAVMQAISHRSPMLQMAQPALLGNTPKYLVLGLASSGTSWPDAGKKISSALGLNSERAAAGGRE